MTALRSVAAAAADLHKNFGGEDATISHRRVHPLRQDKEVVALGPVREGGFRDVTIDLAPMKEIRVDPEKRTVRAEGGVTWAELNRETQRYGLAVTGGVAPGLAKHTRRWNPSPPLADM